MSAPLQLVAACLSLVAVLGFVRTADATPTAAPDAAAVESFDEGRKLMAAGRYADAIARFEESLRHSRTVGALLNLGRCYEETGRAASAWATYRAGESIARELHDAREGDARRFAEAVRPHVSTLTLDARAVAEVPDVTLKRDGVEVGAAAREKATPIDPGEHLIEVRAPGRKTWQGTVQVKSDGDAATLRIPALEEAPHQTAPEAVRVGVQASSPGLRRPVGWIATGVGAAGIGVGAVAGLFAVKEHSDATSACPTYPNHCPSNGAADGPNSSSRTWATVSTVGFIAGGAALVSGVLLVLTAPRAEPRPVTARLSPIVTERGVGAGVSGAW